MVRMLRIINTNRFPLGCCVFLRMMKVMMRMSGIMNINLPTIGENVLLRFTDRFMIRMSGIVYSNLLSIGKRMFLGKMKVV